MSADDLWVCIGHSHVWALAHAEPAPSMPLDTINFWDTGDPWCEEDGVRTVRADLLARVERGSRVVSLVGGSAHTVLGIVEHHRPFDFVLPSHPEIPVDETRELLPADAVRAKLFDLTRDHLAMIPIISAVAKGPIVHLGPPPPCSDDTKIANPLLWHLFPDQPQRVAPKWLRYKLWLLHNELIADVCGNYGVAFRQAPDRAKDSEGFLAPYYDRDGGHHGNGRYGALVLADLADS